MSVGLAIVGCLLGDMQSHNGIPSEGRTAGRRQQFDKSLCCVPVVVATATAAGRPLDVTVAATDLKAGDVALSVPQKLVVTLDRLVVTLISNRVFRLERVLLIDVPGRCLRVDNC